MQRYYKVPGEEGSQWIPGFVISGVLLIKRPWHIASAGDWTRELESCDQNAKVGKVRLAMTKTSAKKPIIYIGLAGERLCDHCNNPFSAYEHLIYKNIDFTSLDIID